MEGALPSTQKESDNNTTAENNNTSSSEIHCKISANENATDQDDKKKKAGQKRRKVTHGKKTRISPEQPTSFTVIVD